MAVAAACGGVLSVEHISGLGVVEPFARRRPVKHVEVFAVVIGMALDAGRALRPTVGIGGMKAFLKAKFEGNLLVALNAAKGRRFG